MTAPRVCSTPGCGTLVARAGRCVSCSRKANRERGSSTARGYGADHRRARAAALAAYKPSDPCARCGGPLGDDPDSLHLDHTDDRTGYLGLSCARCNLQAAGRAAHAKESP